MDPTAILFDLDGVLLDTATLHRAAWSELFRGPEATGLGTVATERGTSDSHGSGGQGVGHRGYGARNERQPGGPTPWPPEDAPVVPDYTDADYYAHIDGRPRYDGIQAVLASRGLTLPWGDPTDPPGDATICALGNRKNATFAALLARTGVPPFPGTLPALEQLRSRGLRLAVVSSSRNARAVLDGAGLTGFFELVVDGVVAADEGLPGKPAPDTFLFAARRLGVMPDRAVVVEDALAGVAAGRAGAFGLVVGVDRGAGAGALRAAGADVVIRGLEELARWTGGIDPWALHAVGPADPRSATLFAVANGYIGVRAAGDPARDQATFVNGFHETYAIHHPEAAYGLARVGQTIQPVPDASGWPQPLAVLWAGSATVSGDGAATVSGPQEIARSSLRSQRARPPGLSQATGPEARGSGTVATERALRATATGPDTVADPATQRRVLDFRRGTVTEDTVLALPDGTPVAVTTTRLVSLTRQNLVIVTHEITPLCHPEPFADAQDRLREGSLPAPPTTVIQAKIPASAGMTPGCDGTGDDLPSGEILRCAQDDRAGVQDDRAVAQDDRAVAQVDRAGDVGEGTADPRRAETAAGGGLEPGPVVRRGDYDVQTFTCRNSRLPLAYAWHTTVTVSDGGSATVSGGGAATVSGPRAIARASLRSPRARPPGLGPEARGSGTVATERALRATATGPDTVADPHTFPALAPGQRLLLTTFAAYATPTLPPLGVADGSLAVVGAADADRDALVATVVTTLDEAREAGLAALVAEQRDWLADFWDRSDVTLEAGPDTPTLQQAIRWNLFQLAQATACCAGHGVAAKGLTGSGYSGHYFWDSDIFVLPFLTYTDPPRARALLEFRHAMLPAARRHARDLDLPGALFPWRTVNGEEASAYFPAGTAQFHLGADIAFAAGQYAAVTGDAEFRAGPGLELVAETARLWLGLGHFGRDGQFHIERVTGPDEYSAIVDDNFYTNVMARHNLLLAADWGEASGRIDAAETAAWRRAGEAMFIGWDEALGVHPQDARFLDLPRWDIAGTPPERRPLLLHYHPLTIYRHQVLKQADVVLALLLQSDRFTAAQKQADFAYYDPLTTGDSTLSAAAQAILAAEVGQPDRALELFRAALATDLEDRHANTRDGVHIASAGGVWLALVQGFGGLRDSGRHPTLDPRLPPAWTTLSFPLTIAGKLTRHNMPS
ncbi:MAG: HAD-IA family hydrolase [Propionibacteriaceae bacterium]|jgi:HAD superfamily hydrolase (TIGR01509 family)|nr:HAD-IA family hydrolase [Propionibacteriaceae bacterium]